VPQEIAPLAELNETHREFVRLVARGRPPTLAAKDCGFHEKTYLVLMRQHAVVWAIRVERQRLLATEGASLGYAVLMELAGDQSVNAGVRRQAAKDLLNLGGHVPPKAENEQSSKSDKPMAEMSREELRALVDRLESELAERAQPVQDVSDGAD
jgi:hypothetical protein